MALTKEDIDAAIAQTENQDAIRHFIEPTHYFENLEEPVAVAIGISQNGTRGEWNFNNVNNVVDVLRKNGIDAVSMLDKEATDPAKFVVSETGVLTPFMKPDDALKATTLICDMCLNAGYKLNGYANLQTNQTLLYSASVSALDERKNIDIYKGHPHPEKFEEISSKYGKDVPSFIDEMVQEAIQNSEEINPSKDFIENYSVGYEHVWRGATLGGKPYAAIFPTNDRKVAYASPNLGISGGYTGCGQTSSGVGGAQYPETHSGFHYGFLYKFKTLGDKQQYHPDMGLQSATGGHYIKVDEDKLNVDENQQILVRQEDFETGVLPHCNKLEAIYLHVKENEFAEKFTVYKIELEENGQAKDSRWQAFLDLHEPTDSSVFGNIAERQDAQKKEQEINPNNAYAFELRKDLVEKNYEDTNYTSLDYLRTVAFKDQIMETEEATVVNGDLKLSHFEDLSSKNLSDVIVNGKLDFMGSGMFSSFEHFPQTKEGIAHAIFVGDLDNETTESLLCKAKGIDWVEKYTHKAEDGHLVIDGEPVIENGGLQSEKRILDFGNIAPMPTIFGMQNIKSVYMNPTSWPKDILNVEFNCDVEFNRITSYEASKFKISYELLSVQDFNMMTQRIENLRKAKDSTYRLDLTIPQKLDLSSYKTKDIDCEGHTHITELPISAESLSYSNIDNMKQEEIPNKLKNVTSLSFNKVSGNDINLENLDGVHVSIRSSNMELSLSGNLDSVYIKDSELMLKNTGSINTGLMIANSKLKSGTILNLSKCERVDLTNCIFSENTTLDLSECKRVDLSNVDLSKANVIMPTNGIVFIDKNVKFAPDYKLDLSNCERGYVDASVQCGEVKLPKRIQSGDYRKIELPSGVKEITTSCIYDSLGYKFNILPHVKIVDTSDENGKKIPLKHLKRKGLSKEQIATLRKERFRNMFRSSQKVPKPVTVEQDIAAMARETGTAVFSYDDIHNSKVGNKLHCDYNKVIAGLSKAQNITPLDAEKKLIECEVLRPLPNGEYLVDVGYSTRRGGGRNFDGTVFFTFSKEDVHSQYHEMAHSYQKQGNLFDDAKIDKMYTPSANGLQVSGGKLADKDTYKTYLNEVHAEIFAQTALMLREKSALGFSKQALYAQSHGESRNAEGLLIGALNEGMGKTAKLYACKPVMHAAIKEVAAIRRSKKRADYFNQDGTLNAKKVAELCEKIVLDNAYSPRTYQSFLDNKFNDNYTGEKDWKKGSLLAVAKLLPAKGIMALQNSGKTIRKSINKIKHGLLHHKEKSLLKDMTIQRQKSDNPQVQAVNDYAYIQAKMLQIGAGSSYVNAGDIVPFMVKDMHEHDMSYDKIRSLAQEIKAPKSLKAFMEIDAIIKENKNNPHFQEIMKNPAVVADVRHTQSNVTEKSKENKEKEILLSDKDKIVALSGRGGGKTHYDTAENPVVSEQVKSEPVQIISEPLINAEQKEVAVSSQKNESQQSGMSVGLSAQSQESVANMSNKEKGHFFHKLRMGINTILAKKDMDNAQIKDVSKTQTMTQQNSGLLQQRMAKNKGMGI